MLGSTVDTCSSSCRTVEVPLSVHRQSGVYCSYLQRQVRTVSNCARLSTTLSWLRGRFPWSRAADHRDFLVAVYDTVVDVCCAGPSSSGSGREETVEIPQLQPVSWTWSFARLLCATTAAHGRCPHAVHRHFSRPCVMQRRCTGEVLQFQFSPLMDIPVVQQRRGILSSADWRR